MIKLNDFLEYITHDNIDNNNPDLMTFVAIINDKNPNKLDMSWDAQYNKCYIKEIQYVKEHNQLVFHLETDLKV